MEERERANADFKNVRWGHSRRSWRGTPSTKCPCGWVDVGRREARSQSLPLRVARFVALLAARQVLGVVATPSLLFVDGRVVMS